MADGQTLLGLGKLPRVGKSFESFEMMELVMVDSFGLLKVRKFLLVAGAEPGVATTKQGGCRPRGGFPGDTLDESDCWPKSVRPNYECRDVLKIEMG